LCQHPLVDVGTNGKKEQHLLHKVGDDRAPLEEYLELFPDDGIKRGEWTPQYFRHASAPPTAARHLGSEVPILVLLRDPVERFLSAMRLGATRGYSPWPYPVPITVQTWSGFYADQLDMWAHFVGRERMQVMVYEDVRKQPQAAVDLVWNRLGLTSVTVPSEEVARPSKSSSKADWTPPEGLEESLTVLYRPQVRRLVDDWGLNVSDWRSFA
jgi:hypothetical protein